MKTIGTILVFMFVFFAGSIAHERDIYRQCVEQGNSGLAGWTMHIKCEPYQEPEL